ncbi:hypothetical protein CYLTODRAFT_450682 [Cylindrobasidium torrendii FP15055 ss-10]|uniref:NADH-ubiquinone oxidoreductase 9.5 kDa subunit n=1 Tax=Cylindrobasidium torrendii FP15055 ss-10 TaxID=1314674 RepID=A0A0D7BPI8_9AGAR|nr:hypothetical protein CYLTODRAFT_450682 [Cylindrobasidium torrendii FP15055 ss-10]
MASAAPAGAFLRAYRILQREAHERPVIFYSCIIGGIGPVLALTVPPFREKYLGYKRADPLPKTYPLPNRARQPPSGYED